MFHDWRQTTIGAEVTLQRGFDITKAEQIDGSVPVVSSSGINSYHNQAMVRGPGVVLGRKGVVGSVFYLEEDFWPHDTSLWVKNFHNNFPKFVYYFFLGRAKEIASMDVGSANPTLNRNHVHPIKIQWPELPEQIRIAETLTTIDGKIEINKKLNKTLESMAKALFKSWFVDFDPVIDNALAAGNPIPEPFQARAERRRQRLHEPVPDGQSPLQPLPAELRQLFSNSFQETEELGWVPEGWRSENFGNVSQCFDKHRVPLSKQQRELKKPGSIPYYGATSVMDHVNEWIFDDIYLLLGEDGSVVTPEGLPFVQYIWGKAWVNNHAHVLQGKGSISTEHLKLFIQCQNIGAYVNGAVQQKLNQKNMNSIPFLLASDDVNWAFSREISPIFSRIRASVDQLNLLSTVRDLLLPKLLSGQLRIPDAEAQLAEAGV